MFGLGGNKTETPEQTELINKIKEMTQTMVDSNPEEVVFAGGSPEKQIQLLTKVAQDNRFRGDVRFKQSPRDNKFYLQYVPQNSTLQNIAAGITGGKH